MKRKPYPLILALGLGCVLALFLVVGVLGLSVADATDHSCQSFFVDHGHHRRARVVRVVDPYRYRVAENVHLEAIIEKAVNRALAKANAKAPGQPAKASPGPALAGLKKSCVRCHSATNPKGGLTLDGSIELDCSTITKALRWIGGVEAGTIPAAMKPVIANMKAGDKGAVMSELLLLERGVKK